MSSDLLKGGNIFTVVAVGLGASVLGPVVAPALRPLAKSLIKGGLIAYDKSRAAFADLNEKTVDMIAEARHEMQSIERGESKPTPAARRGGGKKSAEARPH